MRNRSSSPLCILLAAAAAALAQPAAPPRVNEPPASVEGEVRDSVTGAPIERAHVAVGRLVNGNQERYGAFTNAEGKFLITGIPAGNYSPTLDRTGYVAPMPVMTSPLNLAAGDKKEGVKLKLTPTGAIIGRVLDADGAPVESISVMAEAGGRSERSATTDDRGVFRIGGLRPGKFRIKAAPANLPLPPEIRTDGTAEVHYSATYYPNALDTKSATAVEVKPALEITGVDIRLVRTPIVRVAGKVLGLPPGTQNASVSLRPQGMGSQTRPDGSFEIWRPDPGKYTISAQVYSSAGLQMSSADLPIEVGESDVENLALQLIAPDDIKGKVEYEDEEARTPPPPPRPVSSAPAGAADSATQRRPVPQPRRISLRGPDGSIRSQVDVGDDGSFTLLRVGPGKYRVLIAGQRVYIKSMSLGPANFEGPQLDLSYGSGGAPLTLHVASAKGIISGVVRDDKGPAGGVRIVLVEDGNERLSTNFSMSKEDGSYAFNGVAPGKYKLFAIEDSQMSMVNQMGTEDFDDVAEKIEVHDRETVNKDLKRK